MGEGSSKRTFVGDDISITSAELCLSIDVFFVNLVLWK